MSTCGAKNPRQDRWGSPPRPRPGRRARTRGLLAAAALLCAAATRGSQEPALVEHQARRGDTLAAVAARYYGTRERADLLARVNGLDPRRQLKAGQVVRVPLSGQYRVRPGDTPSRIAERLLGGASRHAVLLEMNGLAPRTSLAAGTDLEIPVRIEHRLERGETLGGLARRYYGDAARAGWIAAFNSIERLDAVPVGTRLEIPLVGLLPGSRSGAAATPARAGAGPSEKKVEAPNGAGRKPGAEPAAAGPAAGKPSATEKQPERKPEAGSPGSSVAAKKTEAPRPADSAGAKKPEPAAAGRAPDPAVERGVELYRRGEYRKSAEVLGAALDSGALSRPERARSLRHRAYCQVALGDAAAARRAFQALRREDPGWKPDSVEDSPKIRRAFSESVTPASAPPAPPSGS